MAALGLATAHERKRRDASEGIADGAARAKVSIRVSPESAKIFFDDAPLTGNPASAMFQRDGLTHRVRAEASGYAKKIELVVLDSATVSVELELDRDNDDLVDPFGNKLTALTFKVAPPTARLYIDDLLLPSNPSIAKFPRDGRSHFLRAAAPGFTAKTLAINFDAAHIPVVWALDAQSATPAPVVAAKRSGRAAETTPADTPSSPSEKHPSPTATAPVAMVKPLDRDDPWAEKR
jgi:hypothetical protein